MGGAVVGVDLGQQALDLRILLIAALSLPGEHLLYLLIHFCVQRRPGLVV